VFERQRLRLKFLEFVRDPTRTALIFEMYELASRAPEAARAVDAIEARAQESADFRALYARRAAMEIPSLASLRSSAEDTLGYAYFAHLRRYDLEPSFYTAPAGERVIDYVSFRLYQTHDLWHVLLGYDVSPAGELGVQAFTLAQLGTPFSFLLMAGGMLNIVESAPEACEDVFGAMADGYRRGRQARFLLGFAFERHWASRLSEVREISGLS
jgi:ubiquinone biosynthesis protein Coq4